MRIPSTNKLLILNAILLAMILGVLIILNFDVLKKKLGHNPNEIYETDNESNTVEKYYPKQDSLKVDLEGLKNDTIDLPGEIIEILETELNSFNWNEAFQTEDLNSLYHETVYAQQFPSDYTPLKKWIILIFSNYAGNNSHAARGGISLFEFQKEQQYWKLSQKHLAFGYGDEYGLDPLGCEIVRIGNKNKYAVIVQTSYSGNWGHDTQSQSVYAEVDHSFELVFDFTSYEYYNDPPENIKYTEGYSCMRILKSDKAWFDIETKSDVYNWQDETPGAVKRFVFNGKEYVETNPPRHQKTF